MNRYTCEQLGACQGDNPNCQLCAIEREARRQTHEDDRPDVWDQIAYLVVVGAASIATVGLLAGLMGFAFQRLTQ